MSEAETFPEIRESVRRLCADFPGSYWQAKDRERAYPTEFVRALTEAGFLSAGVGLEVTFFHMVFQYFLVIAPGITAAILPSRRFFPFGFCRQSFPLPLAKGSGLVPRNIGHRMLRPLWVIERLAVFGRRTAASFHALSVPHVCGFVSVEPVGTKVHSV